MKYIGKEYDNYIIDKQVNRDRKTNEITNITYMASYGMNEISAVRFYQEEKEWLEKKFKTIEWIEVDK